MCHLVGLQAGCIVATHLVNACAQRSRTIILAYDDIGIRAESALEIWTDWGHKDQEQILRSGMYTHLSTRTDEQWTDVQCGAALIGRDKAFVQANHLLHHLDETFGGNLGHQDATAGTLQAGGVLVSTEHTHLAVRASVGLQSLECFLPVVQTGGRHVQGNGLL